MKTQKDKIQYKPITNKIIYISRRRQPLCDLPLKINKSTIHGKKSLNLSQIHFILFSEIQFYFYFHISRCIYISIYIGIENIFLKNNIRFRLNFAKISCRSGRTKPAQVVLVEANDLLRPSVLELSFGSRRIFVENCPFREVRGDYFLHGGGVQLP